MAHLSVHAIGDLFSGFAAGNWGIVASQFVAGLAWVMFVSGAIKEIKALRAFRLPGQNPAANRFVGALADEGFLKTRQDRVMLWLRAIVLSGVSAAFTIGIWRAKDGPIILVIAAPLLTALFLAEWITNAGAKAPKPRRRHP